MLSFLVPVDLISVISGFIVSMTGHYKIMFLVGSISIAIGGELQTMLTIDSGRVAQVCYQIVSGASVGFRIQKQGRNIYRRVCLRMSHYAMHVSLFVAAQASAPENRCICLHYWPCVMQANMHVVNCYIKGSYLQLF